MTCDNTNPAAAQAFALAGIVGDTGPIFYRLEDLKSSRGEHSRGVWGYGVRDMGLYIDPLTDSWRFLTAATGRLPILLLGQWSPIPAELGIVLRPPLLHRFLVVRGGIPGRALLGDGPAPSPRFPGEFLGHGHDPRRIPVSATIPMDRLLTFVGIGAAGLLAQFWEFVFAAAGTPPDSRLARPVEGGGVVPRGRPRGHRPDRPPDAGRQPAGAGVG